MTVVSAQGRSSLGFPIRTDAPAPRMMTPSAGFFGAALIGKSHHNFARSVLECASPLALLYCRLAVAKRQRAATLQNLTEIKRFSRGSSSRHSNGFGSFLNQLRDNTHGNFIRADGSDVQTNRTRDAVELFRRGKLLLQELFPHDAGLAATANHPQKRKRKADPFRQHQRVVLMS